MLPLSSGYFITGTDTDIGKTTYACKLLKELNQQGLRTIGVKPIASGCQRTPQGLVNQDALQLQQHASIKLPIAAINPITIEAPISPHFSPKPLSAKEIHQACQTALQAPHDIAVVEGAGGWHCPINATETMADLAQCFGFPVILVVGIRLGCLNHSLLTLESLQNRQIPLIGWVANRLEPEMTHLSENIAYLTQAIGLEPIVI